jgi:spore coat polysaccharide biosynthesis protein SpsF
MVSQSCELGGTVSKEHSILFRCDAGPEVGLGHVVRCLALADELAEVHDYRITFAMRRGPLGFEIVRDKGYPVLTPPGGAEPFAYDAWLDEVLRETQARALVLDVRDDLSRAAIAAIRKRNTRIVTIDDPSQRRLEADLAFYPPVPQLWGVNWDGFTGQLRIGWEWVILRREFTRRRPRASNPRPVILVTMGGSDPAGLTLKAVRGLELITADFQTVVVLGPGFMHHESLMSLLRSSRPRYEILQDPRDVAGLMAKADLALASFGVTAYELAAMGVPAVYLCLSADHAESATAFENAGMAHSLGEHHAVNSKTIAAAMESLLADVAARDRMSRNASLHASGQGGVNISAMIAGAINGHGACTAAAPSICTMF